MRIELDEILKNFPKRYPNSHKGSYGKVLNISGSKYYSGAAIFSSLSALKSGAGYITLACPSEITSIISSYTPDVTLFPLKSENGAIAKEAASVLSDKAAEYDVISIGSGLSQENNTKEFVADFLNKIEKPVIIDADGLNAIAFYDIKKLPSKAIITPHPKELSRLLNVSIDEIQEHREEYAKTASKKYSCITVLKGMNTIVTDGSKYYINNSGNSALAKAGTGDVLTGLISGLYAQKKDLFYSAALGVYIHGLAADIAALKTTEYGLLASELIEYIPEAIKKITLKY